MGLWTWVFQGKSSVLPCLSHLGQILEPLIGATQHFSLWEKQASSFFPHPCHHDWAQHLPVTWPLGFSWEQRVGSFSSLSVELLCSAWLMTIGSFPVWSYSLLVQNSNKNLNAFENQFTPLWTFSSAWWKTSYRLNTMVQPITGAQRLMVV